MVAFIESLLHVYEFGYEVVTHELIYIYLLWVWKGLKGYVHVTTLVALLYTHLSDIYTNYNIDGYNYPTIIR